MNRLIGITGGMSSGKTTLSKELLKMNKDFIYIDIDEYRRSLYSQLDYINELKESIIELKEYDEINSIILNKYIYKDDNIISSAFSFIASLTSSSRLL